MKLRQRGKGTGQMAGKIDPGRGKGSGSWASGFLGGAGAGRGISIRLRFILIVVGVIALAVCDLPAETRAAGQLPWEVREVPVSETMSFSGNKALSSHIISNDGEGQAWNITPRRVITNPETVTVCGGRQAPGSSIRVGR